MRVAAGVEYKGTHFCGWQSQRNARTVQACVEQALGRVADHPLRVVTAGRTDTGVHASGQVVHFDTHSARSPYSWMRGANSNLPVDARITWVRPVAADFHARFGARERSYRYILYCSPSRPAILGKLCTWSCYRLDAARMRQGAAYLRGTHDFSTFRAAGCQARSPVRTVTGVAVEAAGPWVWMDISADAFLQHMVRNIIGSLIEVGRGERPAGWIGELIGARHRPSAGMTAPPDGLYLSAVRYEERYGLPAPMPPVRFW